LNIVILWFLLLGQVNWDRFVQS